MTFRGIYSEYHITTYHNGIAIFVYSVLLMSFNIGATFIHNPSQKSVFIVRSRIRHIHPVGCTFDISTAHRNQHIVGTNGRVTVINIGYQEGVESHGVEVKFVTFGHAICQFSFNNFTDLVNVQGVGRIGSGIVLNIPYPTAELGVGRQRSGARVIHNLVEMGSGGLARGHINPLHINGHHIAAHLVEVHLQASLITGASFLTHNIHGEGACGEGNGVVGGGHIGHELQTVGALVVNGERGAIVEGGVGDGHLHGLSGCGLPSAAPFGNGNVIRAESVPAVRHRAGHRGGAHARVVGQLARHGKVHRRTTLGDGAGFLRHGLCAVLRITHHINPHNHGENNAEREEGFHHPFLPFRNGCETGNRLGVVL